VELVQYTTVGAVARITLNRPPVNALNAQLIGEIREALDMASDPAIRAVVLNGEGRHFAAGADIKRFVDSFDKVDGGEEQQASGLGDVVKQLEALPKPSIAAIHGSALGGGLELAMGASFRYLARSASVGQPEILLGIIPGAGGTQRLPRLVGYQKALEMNLSGRKVAADEALAMGLADKVVDDEYLVEVAMADAAKWAEGPTLGYRTVKDAMRRGWGRPLDEALAIEREEFNRVFRTGDAKRGIMAFINKEAPEFTGE
jgi:enoyl-CoA hydratase/carnithine racemase